MLFRSESVACQAPLSTGFSRQDYWSGLPFPSPGDLPDPRMEPESLKSPVLTGRFFTIGTTWDIIGLILCLIVLICILLNISEAEPRLKWVFSLLTCLLAQMVKCLSTMRETQIQSLGQEDPLEKEMAIHSSTIAWKIPWTQEPGRLQSMGSQRVGHD